MENKKNIKFKETGVTLISIILFLIFIIIILVIAIIFSIKFYKNKTTITSISEKNELDLPLNENTSGKYNKENSDLPYLPNGFSFSNVNGETTIEQGLVIVDNAGNEFVWIPVPNDGTGPNYSKVKKTKIDSDDYYNEIELSLLSYTEDVGDCGYSGTLYIDDYEYSKTSEEILGIEDYTSLKRKMLKSIYTNSGFYIGRYETGTKEWSQDMYNGELICKPLIQKDLYPYFCVTCKQAQKLSEKFESGNYNSSLMFGIQWNLALKYINETGNKDCKDSTSWGNYINSSFKITSKNAKCISEESADESKWIKSPFEKNIDELLILTTGASENNKVLNIYDIAGNAEEYTLERNIRDDSETDPIVVRGGCADDDGEFGSVSSYRDYSAESNEFGVTFRIAIY